DLHKRGQGAGLVATGAHPGVVVRAQLPVLLRGELPEFGHPSRLVVSPLDGGRVNQPGQPGSGAMGAQGEELGAVCVIAIKVEPGVGEVDDAEAAEVAHRQISHKGRYRSAVQAFGDMALAQWDTGTAKPRAAGEIDGANGQSEVFPF